MSSNSRRERELANAKRQRQLANSSANQTRSNVVLIGFIAVVLGLIAWILIGSGDNSANPTPSNSATPTPTASLSLLDYCDEAPSPTMDPVQFDAAADMGLKAAQLWTLETNCGDIEIELFTNKAPITVNSFAFLTAENWMDGIVCHRLTTSGLYVLQCGDPTATGTGGPGYTIPEENLPAAGENNYPAGTVAMARTATPGSGGSQFFIVFQDTTLGPDYTIFGQVTKGLEIVQDIAENGVFGGGADGIPNQPIGFLNVEMEKKVS